MKEGSAQLLSFLATQHGRAQLELDELRQRGLELVIAACIAELRGTTSESPSVPLDTSVLSEADVAAEPVRPRAPKPEPEEETGKGWEWLGPDEPPTLEDEPEAPVDEAGPPVDEPEPIVEEPQIPQRPPVRPVERALPAPPVSPDPAVEDVRGAWRPPPNG